jgi:hypothetical protein
LRAFHYCVIRALLARPDDAGPSFVLGAQPPAQPHSGKGRLAVAEKKTNKGRDLINFFGFDSGNSPVQLLPDGTVAGLVVQCRFRTGL